ncbi:D-aminoacyl-tRNA deacylase [Bacillus piscicola]|uniref:D-aminoacyl-tRNA deacylase n=1 Tax=Bacillus piscicola TaxID=1632684 RepID=UPI001F09A757|nr:D-aminoacyl-tRNA deacylase [Bacillus piscicola]
MKAVIQRATQGVCTVDGEVTGSIENGLVVLVGFTHEDTEKDVEWMAEKIIHLRIFEDDDEKLNRSLLDIHGSVLSISQFTLYGDCKKGRRPNFMDAAKPEAATDLYDRFNAILKEKGIQVETGVFGAHMQISLTNDGPVTLILDSPSKS